MARQTPLPRFRLDTDSITERNYSDIRAASASPNMSQAHDERQPTLQLQIQRSQNRIRRSACSDLQSTTIPEEHVYNENRRRASLFVGRPAQQTADIPKISLCDQEPAEYDYAKLCRLKCQSLYGSLTNSTVVSPTPVSPVVLSGDTFTVGSDDDEDDDNEDDEDEEERCFQTPPKNNFRHSLPDTSPAGLAIRNLLKRNKTANYNNNHHPHNHRLGLPTHSSQSLCSSTSSSSNILTNSSSPLSTFRNFLSLVKLPSSASSTKSINSTTSSSTSMTPHHSSLTTLTSATGGSSTTLDQTTSTISSKKRPTTGIDTQYQWHFEVSMSTQ
jgi:hypothetical protein